MEATTRVSRANSGIPDGRRQEALPQTVTVLIEIGDVTLLVEMERGEFATPVDEQRSMNRTDSCLVSTNEPLIVDDRETIAGVEMVEINLPGEYLRKVEREVDVSVRLEQ